MIAELLVLVALPLLLAVAGLYDLASFTIPNVLTLGVIAAFVAFVAALPLPMAGIALHLLAGFLGLAIGFALFALGYVGGGDAKLFAGVALWLGWHDLLPYAVVASILGGVLTLGLLSVRRLPLPLFLARLPWVAKLHDDRSGIPYGVALAAGVFVILPQAQIFRLAAGV